MGRPIFATSVCIALLVLVKTAFPQDRIFNYTYQSGVLGPQQLELEVWNTVRWGRSTFFRSLDQRLEFEVGLARNLQTAFYLNHRSIAMASTVTGSPTVASYLDTKDEFSFSNEWKYKVLDPVADPLGLGFYAEYSLSPSVIELEPRLIIDKLVGRTLFALNVAAEFESEQGIEPDGTERLAHDTGIDVNFAAGVRLGEGVHLSVEVYSENGIQDGSVGYSALFAGPTFSYATEHFWVNFAFLPQVAALKGATEGNLVLGDAERYQSRLMFSYAF